eukprot:snap_masked-scaffold_2-processed-gene-25.41-mRNA-1 protein AED:1.00 eAED:1.00 QI:0/0/0/0/1/1/2/0/352
MISLKETLHKSENRVNQVDWWRKDSRLFILIKTIKVKPEYRHRGLQNLKRSTRKIRTIIFLATNPDVSFNCANAVTEELSVFNKVKHIRFDSPSSSFYTFTILNQLFKKNKNIIDCYFYRIDFLFSHLPLLNNIFQLLEFKIGFGNVYVDNLYFENKTKRSLMGNKVYAQYFKLRGKIKLPNDFLPCFSKSFFLFQYITKLTVEVPYFIRAEHLIALDNNEILFNLKFLEVKLIDPSSKIMLAEKYLLTKALYKLRNLDLFFCFHAIRDGTTPSILSFLLHSIIASKITCGTRMTSIWLANYARSKVEEQEEMIQHKLERLLLLLHGEECQIVLKDPGKELQLLGMGRLPSL